jgi:pyruvate dehydrogenase E2 component (dihydrolipoamide acetyltransferase)
VVHDVNIPALGMAMTEAVLTRWHKQPGEQVTVGDVIAEIETDKSNVDLESPADGTLGRHLVSEGETVPVGSPVTRVLGPEESEASGTEASLVVQEAAAAAQGATLPPDATRDAASPVEPVVAAPPPLPSHSDGTLRSDGAVPQAPGVRRYDPPARPPHALSPRKRRLARMEAEAEAFFAVTAEGGPTQAREAVAARSAGIDAAPARPMPSATPPARSPGRYRAAIAERVAQSWREIPHFAVQREVDAGEGDSVLAAVRTRDPDATWTDLLLRAFALAVREVAPASPGDVGLAVATPDGVIMPVVAGVPDLDLSSLVTRRTAAVRRGREGKLSPSDLAGTAVGSLSNLGARGVDAFTGIIPLGQQLLLTVGRVAARPVVADGRLAVRTTVIATLNVDHRSFDGDQAAAVLAGFERELGTLRGWAEGVHR